MLEEHCEIVGDHDPENYTFTIPFDVSVGGATTPTGTIFLPNAEFLFRVLGIAPSNVSDNTLVPVGTYESATRRAPSETLPTSARFGVDVARFGKDYGTLYTMAGGTVKRAAQFWKQDTVAYKEAIKSAALALPHTVTSLHIRIDGGGGFGGGVIDQLRIDDELIKRFTDYQILEVHFNGTPSNGKRYYDLVTEMYAEASESLKRLSLVKPPVTLEADLCERFYEWRNVQSVSVKKLEEKDKFKKRLDRSPDDGDGFVLCVAPDFLFKRAPDKPAYRPTMGGVAIKR